MKFVYIPLAAAYSFGLEVRDHRDRRRLARGDDSGDGGEPHSVSGELESSRHIATTGGEVRVSMSAVGGEAPSNCKLVDEDGRLMLQATYERGGGLKLRWGDAYPAQAFCSAARDGWFNLIVMEGTDRYELRLDPNGVSGVRATDALHGQDRGLGYTKQGELVVDPWGIGRIVSEEASALPGNQVEAEGAGENGAVWPGLEIVAGRRPGLFAMAQHGIALSRDWEGPVRSVEPRPRPRRSRRSEPHRGSCVGPGSPAFAPAPDSNASGPRRPRWPGGSDRFEGQLVVVVPDDHFAVMLRKLLQGRPDRAIALVDLESARRRRDRA